MQGTQIVASPNMAAMHSWLYQTSKVHVLYSHAASGQQNKGDGSTHYFIVLNSGRVEHPHLQEVSFKLFHLSGGGGGGGGGRAGLEGRGRSLQTGFL